MGQGVHLLSLFSIEFVSVHKQEFSLRLYTRLFVQTHVDNSVSYVEYSGHGKQMLS